MAAPHMVILRARQLQLTQVLHRSCAMYKQSIRILECLSSV